MSMDPEKLCDRCGCDENRMGCQCERVECERCGQNVRDDLTVSCGEHLFCSSDCMDNYCEAAWQAQQERAAYVSDR